MELCSPSVPHGVPRCPAGVHRDGGRDQAPLRAGGRIPDGFPPFPSGSQGLQERESSSGRCSALTSVPFGYGGLVAPQDSDSAPACLCPGPSAWGTGPRLHSAFRSHLRVRADQPQVFPSPEGSRRSCCLCCSSPLPSACRSCTAT